MRRIHIALQVDDLQQSTKFYTVLFGAPPTTTKPDYAKWLIDDPRVNFSITERPGRGGIEHLGIQADDEDELHRLYDHVAAADTAMREEGHTVCCYAQSEKAWVQDPQGVEWEMFYTYGESDTFYDEADSNCCATACCGEAEVA